jgi:hypothetical protein
MLLETTNLTELELFARIKLQLFPTKRQANACLKKLKAISSDQYGYLVTALKEDAEGNLFDFCIKSRADFQAKIDSDVTLFRKSGYVSYKD